MKTSPAPALTSPGERWSSSRRDSSSSNRARRIDIPYPVRSVLRRWREMIGIVIGVGIALGIVMTLSGVGRAVMDIYTVDYHRSSASLYVTTQGGKLIPLLPNDSPGTIKQGSEILSEIRAVPGVESAMSVMTWTMVRDREGPRRSDQPAEQVIVMGVDGDPATMPGVLDLKEGRWLRRSDEVVLGSKLSRDKQLRVGDSLRLNGRTFIVSGVGRLRGFGYGLDSTAFMDAQAFRQRADVADVQSIIAVRTAPGDDLRQPIAQLGELAVWDVQNLVAEAQRILSSELITYYVLDALALAIGALFVATMLNHSVAERRMEFATLKAIGVPTHSILISVAMEALTISLVAGVVGVALALGLGWVLNDYLAPSYGFEMMFSADAGLFFQTFALASALGLAAGLFPARRATRVDPVEVLREA